MLQEGRVASRDLNLAVTHIEHNPDISLATAAMMCVPRMSALAVVLLLAGCSTSLARQQDMQSYKISSASELLGVVISSSNNYQQAIPDSCSLHACIAAAPLTPLSTVAGSSTCKLQQIGKILPMRGSLILEPLLLLDILQDTNSNHNDSSILGSNSTLQHVHTNSSRTIEEAPPYDSIGSADAGGPVTVHMAASCSSSIRRHTYARDANNLGSLQRVEASTAGAIPHCEQNIGLQVQHPEQHAQQGDVLQLVWTNTVAVKLTSSVPEQLLEQDSQTWSVATPITLPEDDSAAADDGTASADGSNDNTAGGRQLLVVPLLLEPAPAEKQLTAADSPANGTVVVAAGEQQVHVIKAQELHMTRAAGWQLWLGRAMLFLLLLGVHVLAYLIAQQSRQAAY